MSASTLIKHHLIVALGVLAPAFAVAEPGPMHGACLNDVKTLCGSIEPGGGRIRDCLREHHSEVSVACKVAIADRMLERAGHRNQWSGHAASQVRPAPNSDE